jgi:hypothetical protein
MPITYESDVTGGAPRNLSAVATNKGTCIALSIEKQHRAPTTTESLVDGLYQQRTQHRTLSLSPKIHYFNLGETPGGHRLPQDAVR